MHDLFVIFQEFVLEIHSFNDLIFLIQFMVWENSYINSFFPIAGKHPWPFNDQVMIYVRHIGPGVLVGQAWQEGKALEQLPQRLCSDILMVKNYASAG